MLVSDADETQPFVLITIVGASVLVAGLLAMAAYVIVKKGTKEVRGGNVV